MSLSSHTLSQARLFQAIKNADINGIDYALNAGAKINEPLLVNELVELGYTESLYSFASNNKTALQVAMETNPEKTHLIRYLLDKGVNPNLRDNSGVGPLEVALESKNKHALPTLLSGNVDVNWPSLDGTTVLHKAIKNKDLSSIGTLILSGANPLQGDANGNTPLHQITGDLDANPGFRKKVLQLMLRSENVLNNFKTLKNNNGETPNDLLNVTDNYLATELNEELARRKVVNSSLNVSVRSGFAGRFSVISKEDLDAKKETDFDVFPKAVILPAVSAADVEKFKEESKEELGLSNNSEYQDEKDILKSDVPTGNMKKVEIPNIMEKLSSLQESLHQPTSQLSFRERLAVRKSLSDKVLEESTELGAIPYQSSGGNKPKPK
jgi:ankyrin repeat protein